jgi:hypothetical protein
MGASVRQAWEGVMSSKLFTVTIGSSYKVDGHPVLLPKRMAFATADMKAAIAGLQASLKAAGGELILSDLFRSYDMQLQAHLDFVNKRKTAFSPPPGGSFHEAGRAFDLDLSRAKIKLAKLWELAAAQGLVPIIKKPDASLDEAWHFECRGSHQIVYDYYKAGNGANFDSPYKAAAASAILAIGVRVDRFGDDQTMALIQAGLVRLGAQIGNIDGQIGPKTRKALENLGVDGSDEAQALSAVNMALQAKFPKEFFDTTAADPGVLHV